MSSRIFSRRSAIHGAGVFASSPIGEGEEIIEYKGTLMRHEEVDLMYDDWEQTGHTFLFVLNDEYMIDGSREGNTSRWINHSCRPNCKAYVKKDEHGDPRKDRVIFEAVRNIESGEELTFRLRNRLESTAHRTSRENLGVPLRCARLQGYPTVTQSLMPGQLASI